MHIQPASAVEPEAIARCLAAVDRRDPLSIPAEFGERERRGALVAMRDGAVVGVGWLHPLGDGHRVEVRVMPGHRRQGIGGALFAAIEGRGAALWASCDAAQVGVRRFLEARAFEPMGVVFVQRWDGVPEDVPGAFRTARIADGDDRTLAARVLAEASRGAWPPPQVDGEALCDPTLRVRLAWRAGQAVGICAARRTDDVWTVGGLAVRPEARRHGVGRGLLCDLMAAAAAEGLGVTLRVSHADEATLGWTGRLGFWTCRSWIGYRRRAPAAARAPAG